MGCGIDLLEVARFRRAVRRQGEAFLRRVFTPEERAYARGKRQAMLHLAVRFAAKEAVIKAVSQVQPQLPLSLRQIEVSNDAAGRPSVTVRASGIRASIYISLSHVASMVTAMAVAVPSARAPRRKVRA
jgi:holo-[acyl-carrier protein] synthase